MTPTFSVEVCNRQRTRRINLRLLRQMVRGLAADWTAEGGTKAPKFAGRLCVQLIDAVAMAELNEKFLGHVGSTDVISFDYREPATMDGWSGEIFISVDDAVACAPKYRAAWPMELMRYAVHGMLHLRGYDDTRPGLRRTMKREENRRLKKLSRRFDLSKLERLKNAA
jgi:rRNA maturation RNase YbeY